ncbi:MAG: DeoR/GlpR family DNA-binding transcription regulator [Lachnospiraceae bacterium]|nr:DeoR/GlpR family DNA-binding transcription regulator [Lachnospiraceae bacterium]
MDSMETRREAIVAFVNEKGNISFNQLKTEFSNVSEMTLRTDLKILDEEKKIVRVHGGAKSVNVVMGTDDLFGKRAVRNISAKQKIAEKAITLLKPHTSVYLDSGSTTTMMARNFPDQPQIIYTTGLSCAMELAKLTQPKVTIPGGALNRYSMSVCGIEGIKELEAVNFDIVFMGITCYSKETGFTCGASEEAKLKQAALKNADLKVILLDSSKIDTRGIFSICNLEDVDIIVSDDELTAEFLRDAVSAGVTVL